MEKIEILGMTLDELRQFVIGMGEKPFRGNQLYHQIYRKQNGFLELMTDLSIRFRNRLREQASLTNPLVQDQQVSLDHTVKFLLKLGDGQLVESVYIPDDERITLCLSTQVGCPMKCGFCATGNAGFTRNLTAGEIIGQYLVISHEKKLYDRSVNIVFMGMGEPLLNYDNVIAAFRIMNDPSGCALSRRKINLSTCGVRDGMRRLAGEKHRPRLAVSLNAATDEARSALMPVNRQYPLHELLEDCRNFPLPWGERITFEYILIRDVNDGIDDARRLVKLLRGIRCKLNLIPYNEYKELPYRSPFRETVLAFQKVLVDARYTAMIRKSRGPDIEAACGQLVPRGSPRINM